MSTLIRYACNFHLYPLSTSFSDPCVLGVVECFSVEGKSKRIEMFAFLNDNALVWANPRQTKDFEKISLMVNSILICFDPCLSLQYIKAWFKLILIIGSVDCELLVVLSVVVCL